MRRPIRRSKWLAFAGQQRRRRPENDPNSIKLRSPYEPQLEEIRQSAPTQARMFSTYNRRTWQVTRVMKFFTICVALMPLALDIVIQQANCRLSSVGTDTNPSSRSLLANNDVVRPEHEHQSNDNSMNLFIFNHSEPANNGELTSFDDYHANETEPRRLLLNRTRRRFGRPEKFQNSDDGKTIDNEKQFQQQQTTTRTRTTRTTTEVPIRDADGRLRHSRGRFRRFSLWAPVKQQQQQQQQQEVEQDNKLAQSNDESNSKDEDASSSFLDGDRTKAQDDNNNSVSKTHIVALSDQWIELQCPLARELPNGNLINNNNNNNNPAQSETSSSSSSSSPASSTGSPGSMAIVWRKNGASVSPSRRIKVNSSNGSLIITSTQLKLDEGRYECALVAQSSQVEEIAVDGPKAISKTSNAKQWKFLKAHQFELNLIEPPRLAPFEFPTDATVGMRILVTCSILRGQQPISFVWLKDNQIIATHPGVVRTVSTNGGLSLSQLHRQQLAESRPQISPGAKTTPAKMMPKNFVGRGDEDSSSEGKNDAGNNNKVRLDYVIYNAPSEQQQQQQISTLNANQNQNPGLRQQSNSKSILASQAADSVGENQLLAVLSDPSFRIRQADDYSILSIEGLELKHSGRYTCSAHNEAARASHSSELVINASPSFVVEPQDADLVSGQTGRLDCAVTGQPKPSVSWHRARETGAQQWDYVPIYDTLRYTNFPNGSLQIANVSQREQGFFLCSARNGFDPELTKLIKLTIHEPAKFANRFKNQETRLDERVSLSCAASGEPPIHLEWIDRDGKLIDANKPTADNKFLIDFERDNSNSTSAMSKLTLTKATRSDSGHYTCQATNKYGSDKMIINLSVQHVPDKVTDLKVTNVTATTISLRWQPPTSSGNSPIHSYLVQYQSDDPLDDLLLSTPSLINTNANSQNGDILSSSPGRSLIDSENKHRQVSADMVGDSSKLRSEMQSFLRSTLGVAISSNYDQSANDEAIDRTLVELTVEKATSNLVVENVAPSCLYRIRLAPINKIGLGQFSEWIRAKTEEAPPSASAQKISALATGPNSIKLTWLPPDRRAWNGPLIGFNIGYRPIDSIFEHNKTFEWTAPSLQSLIRPAEDANHEGQSKLNQALLRSSSNISPNASSSLIHLANQQQSSAIDNKNSSSGSTPASSNYYLLKQHLRQLLVLQQQELIAHLTNLQRSTTYLVWLQAINSRGIGPQSHAISIKTLDDVPPSAPSIKIQSTSSNSITLTWSLLNNFISPANQYSLFYRKLPSLIPTPGQNQYANGTHATSSMDAHNVPFIEKIITSHQLIMAGNLFLGADQDTSNQQQQQLLQPIDHDQFHVNNHKGSPNNHLHSQQHYQQFVYTLDQLDCGSVYELYMSTRNSVGKSEPSSIVTTRTTGEPPLAPANKNNLFARIGFNDVLLNLASWSNGGCPLTHMSIVYKPSPVPVAAASASENSKSLGPNVVDSSILSPTSSTTTTQSQLANTTQTTSTQPFTIQVAPILLATLNGVDQPLSKQQQQQLITGTRLDGENSGLAAQPAMLHSPIYNLKNLLPNNCYDLEIVAYNQAGHTRAQYEFVTSHPNDTRSGFSRKEGIFRIDQRGTLIDSIVNGVSDNQMHSNNHHPKSPAFGDPNYPTTLHLPIGQNQLEAHQLAPLIFLMLCLICLLVSSTFCYYRFRDSWKFNANSGGRPHNHRNHHHNLNHQLGRPSSADTATNLDSGSSSGCHHVGGGGGHASSTICQSSPLSIGGKSSMWRMNGHFAAKNNTIDQRHQERYHLNDTGVGSSPIHYCGRDPALDSGDNHYYDHHQATASLLANNSVNPPSTFAQSVSMRDFNLIAGNAQLHSMKNQNSHRNQHHNHHATTLNLKHYRSGLNHNPEDLRAQHRMSTLRTRLVSATPYDNLIQPPHHQHTIGGLFNCSNNTNSNNIDNNNNNNPETYQSRILLSSGVGAPSKDIAFEQHQSMLQAEYGYNFASNVSQQQPESNYNNIALDNDQQLAETSWTAMPPAVLPTNYAIPSHAMANNAALNNPPELSIGNENFIKQTMSDQCQVDCNQTQANINVCIQDLLNQEYQQQQNYTTLVQQQLPACLSDEQNATESILLHQHQQQESSKNKTLTTHSVVGSSSGSSSSGIDLGQQSDVGSTSTANSANHNHHQFSNILNSSNQTQKIDT